MERQVGRGKSMVKWMNDRLCRIEQHIAQTPYKGALDTRIIILTINFWHDNQFYH